MPIQSHPGPVNGRSVMQQALMARLPKAGLTATPLGGAPQVGAPLPVYHLGLTDLLTTAAPLARAVITSWRYPVIGGLEPGLADVREGGPGQGDTRFGGLLQGLFARRLLQASQLAANALENEPDSFEPRMLEVPGLEFSALWLHAVDSDWFVPLLDGTPPGSGPLMLMREIVTDLRARAVARPRPLLSATAAGSTPIN